MNARSRLPGIYTEKAVVACVRVTQSLSSYTGGTMWKTFSDRPADVLPSGLYRVGVLPSCILRTYTAAAGTAEFHSSHSILLWIQPRYVGGYYYSHICGDNQNFDGY